MGSHLRFEISPETQLQAGGRRLKAMMVVSGLADLSGEGS